MWYIAPNPSAPRPANGVLHCGFGWATDASNDINDINDIVRYYDVNPDGGNWLERSIRFLGRLITDDAKGLFGGIVSKLVQPFRGLFRIGRGLFNGDFRAIVDGIKDLVGVALPSYGSTTGWAWPGTIGNVPITPTVDNNLDDYASGWHDNQPLMKSEAQFGWIERAWTGPDRRFSAGDALALGPYGQAVRAVGTVGFFTIGAAQLGFESAFDR